MEQKDKTRDKLLRVTTVDISLDLLLHGQLQFLNQYYDVVGVAADTGVLQAVGTREGVRVVNVPMRRKIALWQDLVSLWRLIHLFWKEKPYIVHANTPKGSLLSMLAAKLCRVPHRLYTITGLRYESVQGIQRLILMNMERIACWCATKVIPEGSGVKQTLMRHRITGKTLKVIHYGNINGIDTEHFSIAACPTTRAEMRQKLGLHAGEFTFVFVGRMVRDKGITELVEAIHLLRQRKLSCRLLLIGWFEQKLSPLPDSCEMFLRTDSSVILAGKQDDIRPYLLAADAFVFPSYREGFPRGPMEAGAMGLPSIVSRVNGCREIIVDGVNGLQVSPRNAVELAEAMAYFLTHPAEVEIMASKAREMIQSRYEQADVWNKLLQMYRNL